MRANRFLLAAGFFSVAGIVHNQERPEWIRHVIAEGFPNQTAVAADFTGDGRLDVITGDITANRERTILYVAPDWKPVVLYTGIRTIHGAVIDVDGNGKPDFVGARYHPGLVYWLERPPDPVRDPWNYHLADDAAQGGADGVHGLWAGDIDGDGKLDLAASSGQPKGGAPDSLVWFRIPPQPRTAARWERYLVADRDAPGLSHYVALSDVNGDGRLDLAAAAKDSPGGNWFAWWEQGADPRKPWKKHLIASDQFGATNIQMADLNGDGKVDFVASRGHGTGLTWYEGPGLTPHDIDTALKGPHSLAIADLNGDGKPDVATVAKDSRVAAWFENDGKGRFNEHRISGDQSAYDIRLIDMDKDGDLDLLVAGFESNNVVWYENRIRK
jgi:hypothetical protein